MYRLFSLREERTSRRSPPPSSKFRREETMSFYRDSSPPPAAVAAQSNLDRLLHCLTPVAPSRLLPQKRINELNSLWQLPGHENDVVEYFTLGDMWKCYDEWSAYGAGTEVQLNCGENIMQYYVPYLSAIQLYSSKSTVAARCGYGGEGESESSGDDSASDRLSRSSSNNSNKTWDSAISSEESTFEHESSLPVKDRLGDLYMQYFDLCSPYSRVPLMDKINDLANRYPGLMALRNVDLSPASWMAVAWYPIYHIPSRKSEKDLTTCFLTYHTLSSSFQDYGNEGIAGPYAAGKAGDDLNGECSGISLPPFGMLTYKMHGDLWLNPETNDRQNLVNLQRAADSWLKQLNVKHHDFNFFAYTPAM